MSDDTTGADLFVEVLERYGVEYVFGNPGTTELPLVEAIGDADLEYRLGLHEDVAVGMAAGYANARLQHAREKTEPGASWDPTECNPASVVNLHVAPGLAHGLGNLYAARKAGAPVVATAGTHETDFRHEEPILSGDVVTLAEEFTKWSEEVDDVAALPTMLRRAFRVALTPPTGPVFLSLPLDVTMAETDADPERLGPIPTAGRGDPAALERAADLLAAAERPAMILGDRVAHAGPDAVDAAVDLAEAAGARVHGEIMAGQTVFPTDHEQWVSFIPPDEEALATAMATDTVVFVGTSTNTTLVGHEDPLVSAETTCIHLGDDAWELGKNQPADAAVLADPGAAMADLADRVADRLDDGEREERLEAVRAATDDFEAAMHQRGADDADDPRASKAQLVDAMREAAPDAVLVEEGVTARQALFARWSFRTGRYFGNKGGGLGYGLPATVGTALAERERDDPRTVIGFVGDGSYLYYPQTIHSAVRDEVDMTVVVVDNQNYRILKDNTKEILGGSDEDHDYVGMDFEPPVDLVANVESHGANAVRAERPEEIRPELEAAIERDGPSVLDVLVHD